MQQKHTNQCISVRATALAQPGRVRVPCSFQAQGGASTDCVCPEVPGTSQGHRERVLSPALAHRKSVNHPCGAGCFFI